jgi:hypothetical protein
VGFIICFEFPLIGFETTTLEEAATGVLIFICGSREFFVEVILTCLPPMVVLVVYKPRSLGCMSPTI